jgi:hypothetical protein
MNGLNIANASIVSCVTRSKSSTDFLRSETMLPIRPPPQRGAALSRSLSGSFRDLVQHRRRSKLVRPLFDGLRLDHTGKLVRKLVSGFLSAKCWRLYKPTSPTIRFMSFGFESPDEA